LAEEKANQREKYLENQKSDDHYSTTITVTKEVVFLFPSLNLKKLLRCQPKNEFLYDCMFLGMMSINIMCASHKVSLAMYFIFQDTSA
jgi:hypothetical protein